MKYRYSYVLNSGVVLGGIGAGSIEIRADGRLYEWLIFNNGPWASRTELRNRTCLDPDSLFFAVRVSNGKDIVVRLLRSSEYYYGASPYTLPWLRPVKAIEYSGEPPFAFLKYIDEKLNRYVDIELETFSPFIPGDLKNSSIPTAIFIFRIENRCENEVEITIVMGLRSPFKKSRITADGNGLYIEGIDVDPLDPLYQGSMYIGVLNGEVSKSIVVAPYPMSTQYWVSREFIDLWVYLRCYGEIKGRESYVGDNAWSIIASRIRIPPHTSREIVFILTWYFPNHLDEYLERLGHYYENFFENARDVAQYIAKNFNYLYSKTREFHDLVYGVEGIDKWIIDLVASQITTLVKSSWLTRDGRFALWEGIGDPYYGGPSTAAFNTTDVMTYVIPTLTVLFPELAKKYIEYQSKFMLTPDSPLYIFYALAIPENRIEFLKEFEKDPSIVSNLEKTRRVVLEIVKRTGKDPSGRVMHFFGKSIKRVDSYHMIDLIPKFVLTSYLVSVWLGDRELLRELLEPMKIAIESILRSQSIDGVMPYHTYPAGADWIFSLFEQARARDIPEDYVKLLPFLLGQRSVSMGFQTFDVWSFYGVSAYVSILWLSALKAIESAMKILGVEDYSRYSELYEKAKKFIYTHLWNGEYFNLWYDPITGSYDRACMAAQLLGQWLAKIASLDYVVDREKVISTLKAIAKYNLFDDEGLINGVYPGRPRPAFRGSTVYDNILNIAFWPTIQMDTPWSGVEFAVASHMLYEKLFDEAKNILKTVHERYEVSGYYWNHIEWGTHYMRALSSWSIVLGIEGLVYNAIENKLLISPITAELKWIITLPGAWGQLIVNEKRLVIEVKFGVLKVKELIIEHRKIKEKHNIVVNVSRGEVESISIDENKLIVRFRDIVEFRESDRIEIVFG